MADLMPFVVDIQSVPIKKQLLRKKCLFQQWYYEFEPNSHTLYVSVPANFSKTPHMLQEIRQFKL